MKAWENLCVIAATVAAAGVSLGDVVTIGTDRSDFALDESWSGDKAPGSGDIAYFGVGGFYGPFTLSADVTYQRFMSGGWGVFDPNDGKAAQQFNLGGHKMTLTGNRVGDPNVFDPCAGGPRNYMVFSNGTIAIGQECPVTIGWNASNSYSSHVRLSKIELTGPPAVYLGLSACYNSELRIDGSSSVSVGKLWISRDGVGGNTDRPNRLIVDHSTLNIASECRICSYGTMELTDGAFFSSGSFESGVGAGLSWTTVSNSTLTTGRLLLGNHTEAQAMVLAQGGATVEGTVAVSIGKDGPATLALSNASLKAYGLVIGSSAGSAGSVLRFCGNACSMEMDDNYAAVRDKDVFGAGGASLLEVTGGAQVNPWSWKEWGGVYPRIHVGGSSSSNVFAVTGAGTVYDSYQGELHVGDSSTSGNLLEVADGATCNVRRLFAFGTNTIRVAGATVNISHGDVYHTSLVVGDDSGAGGELVLAGSAPKVNFVDTASHGGIKIRPGARIVYELPATPYAVAPLETFWLNIVYDGDRIGQIDIDVSNIPDTHERLAYRLATVDETEWLHQDVIDRVNGLDQVKAVGGRLAWKGKDLLFTVPSTLGMSIIIR